MIVEVIVVGPLQVNATLIGCEDTKKAVIIDPGGDADNILARLAHHHLTLETVALTHAHVDHIGGLAELKEKTNATLYMHQSEEVVYQNAPRLGMMFGVSIGDLPEIDHYFKEGDTFTVGNITLSVIETPGHTPGGVTFHFKSVENKDILIAGDTLFAGSIGRTDLPGGDFNTLISSIKNKLLNYSDETVVITGHGPMTAIGRERHTNPFLQGF
jgi:glyoxylase-like metal-dependent hydrolase (beta-lactamase superfamily II)